ncbi:hypothetical protein YC2023_100205 [Brassica napus]
MGLFVILSNGILTWATGFVDIKLWAIIILGFLFEVSIESAPLGMATYENQKELWEIIAGRVPGRKAVEIERYWIMRKNTHIFLPSSKP